MLNDTKMMEARQMLMGIGLAAKNTGPRKFHSDTIPISLISGFLGSGKTTLLTHIVTGKINRRLVVLVNDFGNVNIDSALIRNKGATTIELTNGCVCCSLSAGLVNTLTSVLAAPNRPDAIVIEASGVADPVSIAHVALSQPGLRIDGLITVADARNLEMHLNNEQLRFTIERQIEAADMIILNKVDLVGPEELIVARKKLEAIAGKARIFDAVYARVPHGILLDTGTFPKGDLPMASQEQKNSSPFKTWTFSSERVFDKNALSKIVEELPPDIFRAKGFVRIAQDPHQKHLLQVVGRRWSISHEGCWNSDAEPSKIVFIGLPDEKAVAKLNDRLRGCEIVPGV